MAPSKSKYDPFFGKSLEYPALAKDCFCQHIPTHLKPYVQFDSFTRVDRTNTEATLKQRHRDIIYAREAYLFICAEH